MPLGDIDPVAQLVRPAGEHVVGSTLDDRICQLLMLGTPLDDDQLAERLAVRRQSVNQACRRLAQCGQLVRHQRHGAKIVNSLVVGAPPASLDTPVPVVTPQSLLSENEVKRAVKEHLEAQGYTVNVRWELGRDQGVDIEATGPGGHHLIEAKGEVALPPQQVNYFLGAIGELVQRMSDPEAVFGLALPDNRQYRGLVNRLPQLARERLRLLVYLVRRTETGFEVTERA